MRAVSDPGAIARPNLPVCGRVLAAAHFTLMFAALMTFAHFSVSEAK